MGLFDRKPKVVLCDVCGKSDLDGCGSASRHIEEIRGDQPSWLPPNLRAQAQGEFTWLCVRCNAYPAMKWPRESGAWAGLSIHLGKAHNAGDMRGMAGGLATPEMIPVR